MANYCSNHIVIKTAVEPSMFLTLNPTPESDSKYKLELQESMLPFNGKNWDLSWWTKWFECHDCTLDETVTTKAPPEPTPIIITQGTRRYPVLQRVPFVPYTYHTWDIGGDSAWAPPLGYLDALYTFLRKLDDRTTIECWYYEPGSQFLGHWYNGIDTEWVTPDIFWSDTLNVDVVYELSPFQSQVLSHFIDVDELIPYKEALEGLTSKEDIKEITEFFSSST